MKLVVCLVAISLTVIVATGALASHGRIEIPYDESPGCGLRKGSSSEVNQSAVAWLSWEDDFEEPVKDLASMPSGFHYLYVQLGGLDELSGCELGVSWTPPANAAASCYALFGSFPPGRPEDNRGRGQGNGGTNDRGTSGSEHGRSFWSEVFAFAECRTNCSDGNIARALFNFSHCTSAVPGRFKLEYCRVTDCQGRMTELEVVGNATILNRSSRRDAPVQVSSVTWGAVKALYATGD